MLFIFIFVSAVCMVLTKDCSCNLDGSTGSLSICKDETTCSCRPSVVSSSSCDNCYPQFYNLSSVNVFGCQRCSCDLGGSLSRECDTETGQCDCKPGVGGRDCDRPSIGSYIPAIYHIKSNLVLQDSISGINIDETAEISGVIEPSEIPDIPPRFELLLNEYPIPISFDDFFKEGATLSRKRALDKRQTRSAFDSKPISKDTAATLSKRQAVRVTHVTNLEFSKPGTYFLILNYTTPTEAPIHVFLSDEMMPAILPPCTNCLIMLAGSLGVKGIIVERAGKQVVRIETSSYFTKIFDIVALPKEYYFTSSLKSDVSPRCNPGPFTELCNKYKYPVESPNHLVEEAESWLSPLSQPAYTQLAGVNLFGSQNTVGATSKLRVDIEVQRGVAYHVIVKYYKPYHYTNFQETVTATVVMVPGRQFGEVQFVPCPWEEGCRAAVASGNQKLKRFVAQSKSVSLTLKVDKDFMVFVDSVTLVRETDWNLDLIQAQFYCIKGPGDNCLPSEFIDLTGYVFYESESSIDAVKKDLADTFYHGTGVLLLDQSEPSLSVVLIENIIPSSEREDYVVIVHYYKYTDATTKGRVNIQDANGSQADVMFSFCPGVSGCRVAGTVPTKVESGVVSHNPSWKGYWTPLSVTGGNTVIIVTVSLTEPDDVYVDYLALVPLKDFTPDMLHPLPLDHGPIFTQYCAYHYLYLNPEPRMEEYCKKIVFSMTTMFNNGTLECECSESGSLSDTCDSLTGQCLCKEGYSGRACHECNIGFHGYPNCTECSCDPEKSNSDICDAITGQCHCVGSFGGLDCGECVPGYYGDGNSAFSCDIPCECDVQGSTSISCDVTTGQCRCEESATGRACDTCSSGYYRFPACYSCNCNEAGSLSAECDHSGTCSCREGYTGQQCNECVPTRYYNGSECVPCDCSALDTTCSSNPYYSYKVSEDFSGGPGDFTLVSSLDNIPSDSVLIAMRYHGNYVLMTDLTTNSEEQYLLLPSSFHGKTSGVHHDNTPATRPQALTYLVEIIGPGELISETIFKGSEVSLVHRSRISRPLLSNKSTQDVASVIITVPFNTTYNWFILGSDDIPPTFSQLQGVLGDLQGIWIRAKMFEGQLVAMFDKIELDYIYPHTDNTTYDTPISDNDTTPFFYPTCDCGVAYTGDLCQNCSLDYSRSPDTGKCDTPCQCNGNSIQCTDQGICLNCEHNSSGEHCENCLTGYYLNSRTRKCEPCRCAVNGRTSRGQECRAEGDGMMCTKCEVGYSGNSCDMCDNGYYGDPYSHVGCLKCPCNDNLNLTVPNACDPVSSRCDVCVTGVTGRHCDECDDGYYGDALSSTCSDCECNIAGSQSSSCDAQGICTCIGDISGDKCDQCAAGWYISPEEGRCVPCDCEFLSSTSGFCDVITGQCSCSPAFSGRTCDVCSDGYFSYYGNCLDCGCSEIGSLNDTCDDSRVCYCKPGYHGEKCDQCSGQFVSDEDGSCTVCGDCPIILLDRIAGVDTTLDQGKTDARIQEYADKIDRIQEKADKIKDKIPDLMELPEIMNYTEPERNDSLVPKSEKLHADIEDFEDKVELLPDDVSLLEQNLKDLIDLIENLTPDDKESDDVLDEIIDLIKAMENRNPIKPLRLQSASKAAIKANESASAMDPVYLTLPTLDPIPYQLQFFEDQLDDMEDELEEEEEGLDTLASGIRDVELAEEAIKEVEEGIRNKTADILAELPGIRQTNNATEQAMDELQMPDLSSLENLVNERQDDLNRLIPLVKPREFNCSALEDLRNVSADDPGPAFIREMIQMEKDIDDLKPQINETIKLADKADEEVDQLNEEISERAATKLDLSADELNPKIGDLDSEEAAQEPAVDETQTANVADRSRLDGIEFPEVPDWSTGDIPDTSVEDIDIQSLEDRVEGLKDVPKLYEIDDKLPALLNKTENAEGKKGILVVEFKSIDYKLRSLRDKIERAKRSAESILIPMRFTGDDSYAKYSTNLPKSGYLSLEASVQPGVEGASGGIVYLGPYQQNARGKRQTEQGDYVEVALQEGQVVCNVNIANKAVTLVNDQVKLEKDVWSHVHLQRMGGVVSLTVEDSEIRKPLETTSSFEASSMVVGRTSHGSLKGSVTDIYLNGERVSQWLSEASAGVNKSVWADRVISADKDVYYLNGDSSYLAFQTLGNSPYLRTVSVQIRTASENGLVMFYGEGDEAEGTADVFAMDLHHGNLRLHYTDANKELQTLVKESEGGRDFSDMTFQDLSAYVQQKRGADTSITSLRSPAGEAKGTVPGVLEFGQYSAPSLTFFGKVPDSVKSRFPGMFGEGRISTIPFTGCMKPYRINNAVLRQHNIETARDVTNGCPDKMLTTLTVKEGGMVKLSESDVGNISFSLASNTFDNVTVLYIGDVAADKYLRISLMEGVLVVTLDFQGVIRESLTSGIIVSTGTRKYIRVLITDRLSLYVDDVLEESIQLKDAMLEALQGFPTSSLYLGNLPDTVAVSLGLSNVPSYTGCISDLVVKSRIFDFQYDATEKNNIILDRCRTIKSPREDLIREATAAPTTAPPTTAAPTAPPTTAPPTTAPPTLPPTLSPVPLQDNTETSPAETEPGYDEMSCVGFHSNPLPDSFLLSSTNGRMNFLKLGSLGAPEISIRMSLSLHLTTVSSSGLLVYTQSTIGNHLYVQFSNDGVHFVTNLAGEPLRISSETRVNDGKPHVITIERSMFNFKLTVDGEVSADSIRDVKLFVLYTHDTLDSCSNGVCVGGVPPSVLQDQSLNISPNFVGCLSNITLNSVKYNATTLTLVGDVPSCSTGPTSTSHYFTEKAAIVPDIQISPSDNILINFKSSSQSGTLASLIDSANNSIVTLSIDQGQVVVTINEAVTLPHDVSDSPLYFCDSAVTHSVNILLLGDSVRINVDEGVDEDVTREMQVDVILDNVVAVRFGGGQFTGCLEDPLINDQLVSLSNPRDNSGVRLNSCPAA